MIRVIAFDLDDTLWQVGPVIIKAEQKLGQWLASEVPNLKYSVTAMRQLRAEVLKEHPSIGHRLTEFRRRLIEKAMLKSDIPAEHASLMSQRAMEVFLTARNEVVFFDGALEVLGQVARDYQLGALTNGNADIERLGLGNHFSFAFSAEQVGAPKPAPDLFLAALEYTSCEPHEMVYVGDDPIRDVDSANKLGIHTVWVRNDSRPGPGETNPDRAIDDIRELPAAIEHLANL